MKVKIIKLLIWLVLVPAAILLYPPMPLKYRHILNSITNPTEYTEKSSNKEWQSALNQLDDYGGVGWMGLNSSDLLSTYKRTKKTKQAKILYANYAISLDTTSPDFNDNLESQAPSLTDSITENINYPKILKEGEKIDPNNSLYNVLLAYYYLNNEYISDKNIHKDTKSQLVDKQLFDLGIKEIIKASQKPAFSTYKKDLNNQRLSILPEIRNTDEYYHASAIAFPGFPGHSRLREFARRTDNAMKALIASGRKEETLIIAKSASNIIANMASDCNSFVDILVNQAISSIILRSARDTFKICGREDLAKQTQSKVTALKLISKDIQKDYKSGLDEVEDFENPAYSFRNYAKSEELKPAAYVSFISKEKLKYTVIWLVVAIGLIWTILKAFYWHIATRRDEKKAELLLLSANAYIRIFSLGFLLPTACYFAISRIIMASSWEKITLNHLMTFNILAAIYGLCIYLIPVFMVGREVRRISIANGIEVPQVKAERVQKLKTYSIALIYAIALFAAYKTSIAIKIAENKEGALLIGLALVTIFGLGLWMLISLIKERANHKSFFGTLCKTLVPIYTVLSLLLSIVIWPYLTNTETKFIKQDKVVFIHKEQNLGGINMLEHRMVEKYKKQIIEVLER